MSDIYIPEGPTRYTYWADPSAPKGTAADAYLTTALPLVLCYVWEVNIRIPPGHAGVTGIALVDSGIFVLPYNANAPAWFIGDDDDLTFPYGAETGNNVLLAYYNTSTLYTHGWQVRIVYTPISAMTGGSGAIPVPASPSWLADPGEV